MKKGSDLIEFAKQFIGYKYVLGAAVPKDAKNWKGAFDCAEFISYCNYQVFGILFGTDTHDVKKANIADGYTGYFKKDVENFGIKIPVEQAAKIPGAMLLRYPAPGAVGHIVFSEGTGQTVEANCTKYGVGEFKLTGRHFDTGILLPGVEYDKAHLDTEFEQPKIVYKLTSPFMTGDYVTAIQKALGFKKSDLDGVFGRKTNDALVKFQTEHELVVDGQIVPGGETSKELGI